LSDPSYPAHPTDSVVGLEHAVRDVYMAVDAAIGEILKELDDAVTVIVTSGDGIGPNYAGCHLMPAILNRLGLYYAAGVGQASASQEGATASPRQKKSAASVVRDLIPFSVRRTISRCLPRQLQHRLSMKWANANIDWTQTQAFCIPNANEAYVRLNLQGREPQGIVASGAAYEKLARELQANLQELVNPHNGRLATQQVVCTDDVFPGERRQHLPDIVLNWDMEAKILSELQADACGFIQGKAAGYQTLPFYTGNHRPAAFVLARGPQIPERYVLDDGHIVDIAPTILAMHGIDPPRYLDGQVWSEFIGQPRASTPQ
jgi:predicted AlkP superfamily phosphohydrolase/phosphomutase